jgi:transcriptional regulator with XRE-family HTH domain
MKDKRIYGMFGPRIKAMRLEQGLKQRQLAELLETDMPMYSKMELGARRVRRDQVTKLAELYKVDETRNSLSPLMVMMSWSSSKDLLQLGVSLRQRRNK